MAVGEVLLVCTKVAHFQVLVLRNHDGKDFEDVFGDGVVVDADERSRLGIDLETLVEAEGGADGI